jgi:peptidyl-dipeptidase A
MAIVPATGPIPAYLLGNIWAQDWDERLSLVAPPNADPAIRSPTS